MVISLFCARRHLYKNNAYFPFLQAKRTLERAYVRHRLLFDPGKKQMIPLRATSDNLILVAFHYF